jgi:hypothetical protein
MWEGRAQSRRRCGDISAPQGLEALQRIACKLVLFDDALLIARSRGGALRAANRRIHRFIARSVGGCGSAAARPHRTGGAVNRIVSAAKRHRPTL